MVPSVSSGDSVKIASTVAVRSAVVRSTTDVSVIAPRTATIGNMTTAVMLGVADGVSVGVALAKLLLDMTGRQHDTARCSIRFTGIGCCSR